MKTIQSIFIALLAVTILASCGGGSFKKTKGGLLYKIISKGDGKKIAAGKFFELQFGETRYQNSGKDTLLSDPSRTMTQVIPLDSASIPPDYYAIFSQVKKGDSIVIRQSTDTILKMNQGMAPPFLKKGGFIISTFKVVDIHDTKEEAEKANVRIMEKARTQDSLKKIEQVKVDDKLIEEYLKKNNINAAKTPLGTYVEIINAGTGAKPDSGKQVSVKYTGMNFEGKKFDSNVDSSFHHTDPYSFVIGQMGSIPGFEDAIKQIGKGGKVKAYIPSVLGYGSMGSPPAIKANENLMFEIELVDVTVPKAAPAPTAPQGH